MTEGKPFKLGGKLSDSKDDPGKDVSVGDTNTKTDLTIDLNNYTYTFASSFGLSEANAKLRGFQILKGALYNEKPSSKFTIKDGTITTTAQGTRFEQIAKNYSNLTLENVTLDGTNLKGQDGGEDGGVLVNSFGNLELKGSTTIKIQPNSGKNIYYALGGKIGGTGSNYNNGFNIKVNLDNDGYIPNIGLFGWVDKKKIKEEDTTDAQKANKFYMGASPTWRAKDYSDKNTFGIDVVKGSVGEITIDGVTIDKAGYTSYSENTPYEVPTSIASSITGTAAVSNISLGATANSLASFGLFDMDTTAAITADANTRLIYQKNGDKYPYTLAIKGWNRAAVDDDTQWNYVASLAGSTQGKGDWLINVKGVTGKSNLVLDDSHKTFGVPAAATASLRNENYKFVNVSYNGDKDAVTVTSDNAANNANPFIATRTTSLTSDGVLAETVKRIYASDITVAVSIKGNDLGNEIYDGGGDNVISLGSGVDTFTFGGGADSILNVDTKDFIKLSSGIDPVIDGSKIDGTTADLVLDFGGDDKINFKGSANIGGNNYLNGVNVETSNGKKYVYTKQSIVQDYGLTLTSAAETPSYDASSSSTFYTIDAAAVQHDISLTGEGHDNYLIGSTTSIAGGTGNYLYGGAGNDTLVGGGKETKNIFRYTNGKDVIADYRSTNDVVNMAAENVTGTKVKGGKLTFNIDSKNDLTFNAVDEEAVEKVSLQSGGFLTKDAFANLSGETKSLKLFASAKGIVDMAGDLYGGNGINAVNAADVKKQSVTLVSDTSGGDFTFASDNKKRDGFEYAGNKVTINSYESGYDRINLGDRGLIAGFTVDTQTSNVGISVSGYTATDNIISLTGAAAKSEVLIHDGDSKGNSYSKMVFKDTGVLINKVKKATEATISAGANHFAPDSDSAYKKIFAIGGVSGISIQSGDNKTLIDASEAGAGISLVGGAKNNDFVGSDYADMFVYKGGKDVIQDFSTATGKVDSISLFDLDMDDVKDAKITASKKSIKFKFASKDILTLKASKGDSLSGALTINGETFNYDKNEISTGDGNVSLTSAFSGTYKIGKNDNISSVDGSLVEKNLTFKGTDAAESFSGGHKKTTFKGGGGADTLIGGEGKDIFFYAKGNKGETAIANFEFSKDKLKIANGTINKIESLDGGGIEFAMNSGNKGETSNVGWFKINSFVNGYSKGTPTSDNDKKVLIKANSTYYWFAETEDSEHDVSVGDLITADKKVTNADAIKTGYGIIDLGYSTNLVKTGVAVKAGDFTFNGSIAKETTTTT